MLPLNPALRILLETSGLELVKAALLLPCDPGGGVDTRPLRRFLGVTAMCGCNGIVALRREARVNDCLFFRHQATMVPSSTAKAVDLQVFDFADIAAYNAALLPRANPENP
ncbi:MAG: hypothetical protein KGK01_13240 [Bradyrhizobium sp.]|nr:hypothetical protein [Bradyrhizobium sp.]